MYVNRSTVSRAERESSDSESDSDSDSNERREDDVRPPQPEAKQTLAQRQTRRQEIIRDIESEDEEEEEEEKEKEVVRQHTEIEIETETETETHTDDQSQLHPASSAPPPSTTAPQTHPPILSVSGDANANESSVSVGNRPSESGIGAKNEVKTGKKETKKERKNDKSTKASTNSEEHSKPQETQKTHKIHKQHKHKHAKDKKKEKEKEKEKERETKTRKICHLLVLCHGNKGHSDDMFHMQQAIDQHFFPAVGHKVRVLRSCFNQTDTRVGIIAGLSLFPSLSLSLSSSDPLGSES